MTRYRRAASREVGPGLKSPHAITGSDICQRSFGCDSDHPAGESETQISSCRGHQEGSLADRSTVQQSESLVSKSGEHSDRSVARAPRSSLSDSISQGSNSLGGAAQSSAGHDALAAKGVRGHGRLMRGWQSRLLQLTHGSQFKSGHRRESTFGWCTVHVHHAPSVQSATEARQRRLAPHWAHVTALLRPGKSGGPGNGVPWPARFSMDV